MLIKANSIAALNPVPHQLGKKTADGKYAVTHPDGCECQMIYTVAHARWVNYDAMHGLATCGHCKAQLELPLPAVRENLWSKRVLMNFRAIENELFRFQIKHENCPDPSQQLAAASSLPQSLTPSAPQPTTSPHPAQ
jgi:hypothetical protein